MAKVGFTSGGDSVFPEWAGNIRIVSPYSRALIGNGYVLKKKEKRVLDDSEEERGEWSCVLHVTRCCSM